MCNLYVIFCVIWVQSNSHFLKKLTFYILLSAHLRLEVILQEEKVDRLKKQLSEFRVSNRKCDKKRQKERNFLKTLIDLGKSDNVQLSDELCTQLCNNKGVKDVDCKLMCYSDTVSKTCADWPNLEKCLKKHQKFNPKKERRKKRNTNLMLDSTRSQSFSMEQKKLTSDFTGDFMSDFNGDFTSDFMENFSEDESNLSGMYLQDGPNTVPRSQSFSLDQRVPLSSDLSKIKINVTYLGALSLRTWTPKASCQSITCQLEPHHQATFCFQKMDPTYYFQFGQHEETYSKDVCVCNLR